MAKLEVLLDEEPGRDAIRLPLAAGDVLLERLLEHGIEVGHDCGGRLACASCRVVVREGVESLNAISEDEQDMLDRASASEPGSRLACQAVAGFGARIDDLLFAGGHGRLGFLLRNADHVVIRLPPHAVLHADRPLAHVAVQPQLGKIPGFLGCTVSTRPSPSTVEILVTTYWQSFSAIDSFAGADRDSAVVAEEAAAFLGDYDKRVRHYEVALSQFPPRS